ncbi:MAG: enolase [Pleurocapsa minor GSE-CHR-MK-17-07R]|jgi:enolase|nr:enolase [Pleurocapsa minor GSE-CHR-MK 17-07R]
MHKIISLTGMEILDSRGRPTVKAICRLESGITAAASVPSGASTGASEALELRDGDPSRYRGRGCLQAAEVINTTLHTALSGRVFDTQAELDLMLIGLDGTQNKAHLGANTLLAVSIAFARACAYEQGLPLYSIFDSLLPGIEAQYMPRPMINLFSGGRHAGGQVAIQDVLVMPVSTIEMPDLLAMTAEVYACAAELTQERYGMRLLRADEGGLAPPFTRVENMFELAVAAIERAGLKPGADVVLALDIAATQFYADGRYNLDERRLSAHDFIALLAAWRRAYPIVSIEDGLAEDDWEHWPSLMQALGGDTVVIGDDLLCTNPSRIRQAAETDSANGLLLKVNQIGTLTEAAESCMLANRARWKVTVSARSGETEDDWLADLAVGWAADFIKIGSITQSERLAKYNRMMEIEGETGTRMAAWAT